MKTIFILCDTLNRRFLPCYGGKDTAKTPNIDRLCEKGTKFENHYCGSSPCMPARRDIMTGRLNFLDRNWGGIEPYDHTLQSILKEHGVFTRMDTDHFHYSEIGGENYWNNFCSWELYRGQEHDGQGLHPDKQGIRTEDSPNNYKGSKCNAFFDNRKHLTCAKDYPTAKTLTGAANWLEDNKDADNFLLWVEGFDPHEPFQVPNEYLAMYEDEYKGDEFCWPDYAPSDSLNDQEIKHIRNRYKANITMTDHYIGKLLDVLDRNEMWDDTVVVLTTDHGYMLGEHGYMAKNYMLDYNELFHIPLIMWHPKATVKTVSALTQNIDMFPTILDIFNISQDVCRNPIHGKNLMSILNGQKDKVRDGIIYGRFGKSVSMTDGKYTYFRNPQREDNQPLNIYCAMPTMLGQYIGYDSVKNEDFKKISLGKLSWTEFPVYKIPADIINWQNESQTFTTRPKFNVENLLFDNVDDYEQQHPISDDKLEFEYVEKLKQLMKLHDAPIEQFERLGLD